jgi:hypothetical protein
MMMNPLVFSSSLEREGWSRTEEDEIALGDKRWANSMWREINGD